MNNVFIHPKGLCESKEIGEQTRIWAFTHVMNGAKIGKNCNVCDYVYIEGGASIGDNVTIKSGVQIWDGLTIENDVFIGPNVTFTNDLFPRSKVRKEVFLKTIIRRKASIGANATILPGIEIGELAMVGAGAVVTKDIPPKAVVVGNPARIIRYIGEKQDFQQVMFFPKEENQTDKIKRVPIKLIIQIPCYNEEATLPLVLADIPQYIDGIDQIEIQVIDDGSTDKTVEVAQSLGVHHIIRNKGNKGLGISFQKGLDHALQQGADILVNTDGDNQYPSAFIADLVQPILEEDAEIVVGNRQTSQIKHFSPLKKFFQWLGTKVTIILSGEKEVEDAVSGFRAYSRQAMLELNVTSRFSYVLDTTVQSSDKRLKMVSVPITTNAPTRPSRLFKNMWQHIRKSAANIMRVYAMYKPLRVFIGLGMIFLTIGSVPIIRFLYDYFFIDGGDGKIQSLVIGSILLSVSFNCFALGIIGDLMSRNRTLIEYILKDVKELKNRKEKNIYEDIDAD